MSDALKAMLSVITDPSMGGIQSLEEINAVGHRVVHGGERFLSSVVINDDVLTAIKDCIPLAPLHNSYNLEGIQEMMKLLPSATHVAVFDTSFHQTIPEKAYKYAIPCELYDSEHIRKYGFHGTNHNYVALKAAIQLNRPFGELKIISCHLGKGASICAIDHGKSIDTSMGITPLGGLVMGTRCGDIDPGVIFHLTRSGRPIDEVERLLNRDSGLKGISGKSNDMREILEEAEKGDIRCKNAISIYCYRVRKYIGAYMTALGGLDALIFTGEIAEKSPEIRARICQGLEPFGIVLFHDSNHKPITNIEETGAISEPASRVKVLVVPANEERMIARETLHAMGRYRSKEDIQKYGSKPIPLSISAHHVHLTEQEFEALFGKRRKPTPKGLLSQPGQFACEESVTLTGPKGKVERVRILGPYRKESQVEISKTEEFKLGIEAPVRDSGDIDGTPGIILEGKAGSVKLEKGVICARRHIHMSPEEALCFGLRDKDVVLVKVESKRDLIFGDVFVRVHPEFRLDMHIDTDEANAAEISEGVVGYIIGIQSRDYM